MQVHAEKMVVRRSNLAKQKLAAREREAQARRDENENECVDEKPTVFSAHDIFGVAKACSRPPSSQPAPGTAYNAGAAASVPVRPDAAASLAAMAAAKAEADAAMEAAKESMRVATKNAFKQAVSDGASNEEARALARAAGKAAWKAAT